MRTVATFEELAARSDDDIDVALGAALIARDVYPEVDVTTLLGRLDDLAAPLAAAAFADRPAHGQADGLAHYMYDTCGFTGNEADYYDPKNSLLPDVLDRRLGIPISLALVYCELAKRAGDTITREDLAVAVRDPAQKGKAGASYDPSVDRSLDVHVSRLRQKLEDDPKEPRFIKTVRGIGYVLARPS